MLMFVGMFLALARRRARFRAAARNFPALGEKLGLEFKPAPNPRSIGTLSGDYRGYRVFVDPDEQRRIMVRFEQEPGVDLRNYEHTRRPPRDTHVFYSGDKRFDSFFKTRVASDMVADRLSAVERPSRLLDPFLGAYYRELKQLNVTPNGVSCVFDFGNPPHIPATAVELLLPAMIELARLVEPHESDP
jgi:hypothetical protein